MIGLTFFTFALPILLLSPVMGKFIDREGGFFALVIGMAGVAICGALYPLVPEVWFVVLLGLVEGTAFALASPAQFMLVARASPPGRSSTAQGIFGAAGTIGTIVASLSAGFLADIDLRFPFFATGIGTGTRAAAGPRHRAPAAVRRDAAGPRRAAGRGPAPAACDGAIPEQAQG